MLRMKHTNEKDIAMQGKLIARDEQQLLLFPQGRIKLGNVELIETRLKYLNRQTD